MKRYISIFKRVIRGLRLATMILVVVLTYLAIFKRGGRASKNTILMLLAFLISSACLLTDMACKPTAALPACKKQKTTGPRRQIFERSSRVSGSKIMSFQGKPAYIVSGLGSMSGVLVTDLSSGMAANIGIDVGDVLLTINQHVVSAASDADRILSGTPTGTIRIAFAHPSDNGLQMYNTQYRYTRQSLADGIQPTFTSFDGGQKFDYQGLASQIPAAESHMVSVVNRDRAQYGLAPLQQSTGLTQLARAHSEDMGKRQFFNHVNPDGLNPADRARAAGLGPVYENIGFSTGCTDLNKAGESSEAVMMAEPPNQNNHRGNILGSKHQSVGVGIALTRDGRFYMTQEFSQGTP